MLVYIYKNKKNFHEHFLHFLQRSAALSLKKTCYSLQFVLAKFLNTSHIKPKISTKQLTLCYKDCQDKLTMSRKGYS